MNAELFFAGDHILENERAKLEPLQESHYPLLLPIGLQDELWEFTSIAVRNEPDFANYFYQALNERKQTLSYPFAVYDKKFNRYAGCTRFGTISFPHKRMEIGWTWYDKTLQRTGINKATKCLLLDFGFNHLLLNRIELKTSLANIKSQLAMLKIGAIQEGILRRHMINENGTLRDSVFFSFIREEWPSIRQKLFSEFP